MGLDEDFGGELAFLGVCLKAEVKGIKDCQHSVPISCHGIRGEVENKSQHYNQNRESKADITTICPNFLLRYFLNLEPQEPRPILSSHPSLPTQACAKS